MKIIRCVLKEDKEKPFEGRHPWVFSGAIDQIDDGFQTGDLVKVFSSRGKFLGTGYLNPRSQIAIRMLAFDDVKIDEHFFKKRILDALRLRQSFLPSRTNACRLIHSEGDFLPGLIADRYGDYLVLQFLTAGMDHWKPVFVKIFQELLIEKQKLKGIFEKDDTEQRDWEGLPKRVEKLAGEEPPDFVEIEENGIQFLVDIHQGQKTGFYLDQRDSRALVGNFSRAKRVLNCFAYTGGFSLYAAKGGATEVVSVESSEAALNTAKNNFEKNGLMSEAYQFVREDVFEYLRSSRQEFDFIILDPPAFCKNKHQIQQAARGYKDINLSALKRLAPGGLLFTSSCSSHITPDLFQKIVFGAAKDAHPPGLSARPPDLRSDRIGDRAGGLDVRILAKTSHPFDHPISIYHPEGEYLKGLLCEVV